MRLQERFQYVARFHLLLVENWRKSLDNKGFGGAILMDLSKAFNTLNHDFLTAKVHAYGVQHGALKLL